MNLYIILSAAIMVLVANASPAPEQPGLVETDEQLKDVAAPETEGLAADESRWGYGGWGGRKYGGWGGYGGYGGYGGGWKGGYGGYGGYGGGWKGGYGGWKGGYGGYWGR